LGQRNPALVQKADFRHLRAVRRVEVTPESKKIIAAVALRFLDIAAGLEAGSELRSIHHAVKCLGCEKIKQVLISSVSLDHFTCQPDHTNFSFNRFSGQARLCAPISGALGRRLSSKWN
jgi:hypothetical protein